MTSPTWFPEATSMFPWNNIILIAWFALWFYPLSPSSRYAVLFPALALALSYTAIFFKGLLYPYNPTDTPITFFTNFFSLPGWQAVVKDPYSIIGITNHFCVMDVWCGQWMVHDFYSQFTCGWTQPPKKDGTGGQLGWTFDRITFTVLLVMTFMVAPFGFLCYQVMRAVRYSQFPSETAVVLAEKKK